MESIAESVMEVVKEDLHSAEKEIQKIKELKDSDFTRVVKNSKIISIVLKNALVFVDRIEVHFDIESEIGNFFKYTARVVFNENLKNLLHPVSLPTFLAAINLIEKYTGLKYLSDVFFTENGKLVWEVDFREK